MEDLIVKNRKYALVELDSLSNTIDLELSKYSFSDFEDSDSGKLSLFFGLTGGLMIGCAVQHTEIQRVVTNSISTTALVCNNNYTPKTSELDPYLSDLKKIISGGNDKEEIIEKIFSFRHLKNDWDGYGAYPLELNASMNALKLVNLLHNKAKELIFKLTDVFPNPNGTVSFLWEDGNERISLEIGNDTFSYYVKFNAQKPKFFNGVSIKNNEEIIRLAKFIASL